MYADDYSFAVDSHWAWMEASNWLTGFKAVFHIAVEKVKYFWWSWGGNYTSVFFTALQPSVYNEKLTFLNVYILLGGGIIIPSFYFGYRCLKQRFGLSRESVLIIISGLIIFSMQWVPPAFEGFYWFNGSFNNIMGYSAALIGVTNVYCIVYGKNHVQ